MHLHLHAAALGGDPRRLLPCAALGAGEHDEATAAAEVVGGYTLAVVRQPGMRQAMARPGRRRVDIAHRGPRRRGRAVGHDGMTVIGEPQLEVMRAEFHPLRYQNLVHACARPVALVPVGQQGAEGPGLHLRRRAGNQAEAGVGDEVIHEREQGPAGVARGNRPALLFIGIEQTVAGLAAHQRRELPREVVCVLDAGIQAQARRGRMAVRGIADCQAAPTAVLVGEDRFDDPVADLVHLDVEIRQLQQRTDARHDEALVEVGVPRAESEVEHPLLRTPIPMRRPHRHHRATAPAAATFRVDEPADQRRVVVDVLRQVCREMRADHVDQVGRPFQLNADGRAHGAAAVRADEILRPHLELLACLKVLHGRGHAALVLLEARQLVAEVNLGERALFGELAQHGLEADQGQVA